MFKAKLAGCCFSQSGRAADRIDAHTAASRQDRCRDRSSGLALWRLAPPDLDLKFPEIGECNRCQELSRLGATVLVQRVVFAHADGATGSRRLTARLEPLWLR